MTSHHFLLLAAAFVLAAIIAGLRARRSIDTAIGHDPYAAAWAHRQHLRNCFEAKYGNFKRMS